MTTPTIQEFAQRLVDLRASGQRIAAETFAPPVTSIGDALAVQSAVATLHEQAGMIPIGYKLGATNQAARDILGVGGPFRGRLFDRSTQPSGERISRDPNFQVWEVEIGLCLGRDLDPADAPFDAAMIEAATAAVLPAIEIVGTVFHPFNKAPAVCLIADNAVHGAWIHGTPVRDWGGMDLLNGQISLSFDGIEQVTGQGANVDGGPFGATAGLANELAAEGKALKAGDYVTTGTVTPIVPIGTEREVRADFGPLGSVSVTIV